MHQNKGKEINLRKQYLLKPIFSSLQRFTTLDDDGYLSLILFTRGCNFRCDYCHNPELVLAPLKAPLLINDIKIFLEKRKDFLDSVVITGGEPTLHGENLINWIKYIKSLGYRVKLDSNGTNPSILRYLISENLIDKIAIDIKSNFENYGKITYFKGGIGNIVESIKIIVSSNVESEFRSTIHSDLHKLNDLEQMVRELRDLGVQNFHIQFFKKREKLVGSLGDDILKSHEGFLRNLLSNNFKVWSLRNLN